MKFRPLHDRVVVKRIDAEEKSKGGIITPDTAKEKPWEGEAVAVGPARERRAASSFRSTSRPATVDGAPPGAVRFLPRRHPGEESSGEGMKTPVASSIQIRWSCTALTPGMFRATASNAWR